MPRLEYFVVCESIAIDGETNRVSLFNIIEDIEPVSKGTPGPILAQMVAVSCWNQQERDENEDFQVILRIHGKETKDFPMNFRMERPRQRLIQRLQGVPAMEPGHLRFELLLNGRHAADHVVAVHPQAQTVEDGTDSDTVTKE